MHKALLGNVIQVCRQRISEGDCPTIASCSVERLEEAVADLAADIDTLLSARTDRDGVIGGDVRLTYDKTLRTIIAVTPGGARFVPEALRTAPQDERAKSETKSTGELMKEYLDRQKDERGKIVAAVASMMEEYNKAAVLADNDQDKALNEAAGDALARAYEAIRHL